MSNHEVLPHPGMRVGLITGVESATRIYQVLGLAYCRGMAIPPDHAAGSTSTHFQRKRQPTPVFELEESDEVVYGTEVLWVKDIAYHEAIGHWRAQECSVVEISTGRMRAALAAAMGPGDDYPFPE